MEDLNILQMASATEPETTTVEMRKNGDAVLVVAHKRFVVSKEILQITSDYFKALCSPSFLEGQAAPDGSCGDIVLHDDDPDAMEIILSILHYNFLDVYRQLSPEMLLNVARHCDKYQCTKPLQPWVLQWMQQMPESASVEEYDLFLTAAYVFGANEQFTAISVAAIRRFPPNFNTYVTGKELQLPKDLQGS